MRLSPKLKLLSILTTPLALGSCQSPLPAIDLEFSNPNSFRKYVESIVRHIRCELGQAVQVEYSPTYPETYNLRNWAAKIALTIRARNSSAINGSSSIFDAASIGIFSIGLGTQSDTTREMVITYFVTFEELLKTNYPREKDNETFKSCSEIGQPPAEENSSSADYLKRPITGNLGIDVTLKSAMETWTTPNLLSSKIQQGPFETVTHHVTFEVKLAANANSALRFANISANVGGRLLDTSRTDTNELQITMGPLVLGSRKVLPSKALNDDFFVERLRSAVRRDN